MRSDVIYIVLGVVDSLAAVSLILKLYMLPMWEYRYRIALLTIFIALFSFLMRVVLNIPQLDLPLQYVFYILFFRYALQIKTHLSTFIVGSGLVDYINIQMLVYFLMNYLGVSPNDVIHTNTGFSIYAIQVTSIITTYIISFVLFRFRYGFTFIMLPPHDFLISENYKSKGNIYILTGSIISLVTVSLTLLMLYNSNATGLFVLSAITIILSYIFSKRTDHENGRSAIEAYRKKNK